MTKIHQDTVTASLSSQVPDISVRDVAPIAVDAMGGDLGSGVVVHGAVRAYREFGIASVIVGKSQEIQARLTELGITSDDQITVCDATEVITMEDAPSAAIRTKRRSSIRVGFELLKEKKVSAIVSPGNTGAVMAAGLFVSGTLPGIVRPAIATLIPRVGEQNPTVLLDSGANTECSALQLTQFAMMGSIYAKSLGLYPSPRVALLSNGSESSKGTDTTREAYEALSKNSNVHFVGYVEGRDIAKDTADVVVCDGFLGNITLKTMEGAVELVIKSLKYYTPRKLRWKLGMYLAKPMFKLLFKEKLDPSAYGGAPLLGLNDVTIICHGSSNDTAIMNAIRIAKKTVDEQLVAKMSHVLRASDVGKEVSQTGVSGAALNEASPIAS